MVRFIPEINLVCSKNIQLADIIVRCIANHHPKHLTHREIYNLTLSYPAHNVRAMTLALANCGALSCRDRSYKLSSQVSGCRPRVMAITTDAAKTLQTLLSQPENTHATLMVLANATGISRTKTGAALRTLQGLSLIQCINENAKQPHYQPIRNITHD